GEGINLQFCHHMINFDLPWNPMRLEQRIGRIHRLGQTEEVYIHNLATENTIEAHMVQLLQEKIRLFEMIIGELDYIVGDHRLGDDFDRQVMDIAMTSDTDTQLQERLNAFGDRVLQEWKREEDTSLWHA
ncbi:MAG: SWF/SNF helicase family protein, partial [Alicyclobacillus shizuokensis]|nr:SWF/SNF helicase family protein [Alicyclobacillus shizuokensis]